MSIPLSGWRKPLPDMIFVFSKSALSLASIFCAPTPAFRVCSAVLVCRSKFAWSLRNGKVGGRPRSLLMPDLGADLLANEIVAPPSRGALRSRVYLPSDLVQIKPFLYVFTTDTSRFCEIG